MLDGRNAALFRAIIKCIRTELLIDPIGFAKKIADNDGRHAVVVEIRAFDAHPRAVVSPRIACNAGVPGDIGERAVAVVAIQHVIGKIARHGISG